VSSPTLAPRAIRRVASGAERGRRELTADDIAKIAGTYHAGRGDPDAGGYEDVRGFYKAATLEEIRAHGHVLTPGRYVGAAAVDDDGEPFEEKMRRLTVSSCGCNRPKRSASTARSTNDLQVFGLTSEWHQAHVADLAANVPNAIVGGPFGSNLVSRDYVDSGVPVIRGQNMGQRWIGGDFAFVTAEKAASLASNLARPFDVVFTQRRTLGQVSLVPDGLFPEYLVSQSQMKLSVDRSIADPMFIYYALTAPAQKDHIERNAIRTGVPHTNLGMLRETPVLLPPLTEQRDIAALLGALDDKIELNRRMSETLEAIARALFRSGRRRALRRISVRNNSSFTGLSGPGLLPAKWRRRNMTRFRPTSGPERVTLRRRSALTYSGLRVQRFVFVAF
jgi:hypothetical protein